ncbi:MAG: PilZ domain-containing protein [Acidobacteriales bacterium]|nr:PilZ domain-containing protein [Terriglobales bacterium]
MPESRTGKRFPIELPIKLHGSQGSEELSGFTANLSAAAVYMRADTDLEAGSEVQFEIKLPSQTTGGTGNVLIQCRGRVVRTEGGGDAGGRGIACVIDAYEFVREP